MEKLSFFSSLINKILQASKHLLEWLFEEEILEIKKLSFFYLVEDIFNIVICQLSDFKKRFFDEIWHRIVESRPREVDASQTGRQFKTERSCLGKIGVFFKVLLDNFLPHQSHYWV